VKNLIFCHDEKIALFLIFLLPSFSSSPFSSLQDSLQIDEKGQATVYFTPTAAGPHHLKVIFYFRGGRREGGREEGGIEEGGR